MRMSTQLKNAGLVGAGVWVAALAGATAAEAQVTVPTLAPGSSYRLIFVTNDSIAATSSDIATYNNFATTEGAQTGLTNVTWSAVVSTSLVNVATNISCGTLCDSSVPVYLTNGTEVAASTSALFSGTLLSGINVGPTGSASTDYYVWTGSSDTGATLNPLGSGSYSNNGAAGWTNGGQFDFSTTGTTYSLPIYEISSVLTVPNTVPEPASLSVFGIGAAATFLRRRRKAKITH